MAAKRSDQDLNHAATPAKRVRYTPATPGMYNPVFPATPRLPGSVSAFDTFPAKEFSSWFDNIKARATAALEDNQALDAEFRRKRQIEEEQEIRKQAARATMLERVQAAMREEEEELRLAVESADRGKLKTKVIDENLVPDSEYAESDASEYTDDELVMDPRVSRNHDLTIPEGDEESSGDEEADEEEDDDDDDEEEERPRITEDTVDLNGNYDDRSEDGASEAYTEESYQEEPSFMHHPARPAPLSLQEDADLEDDDARSYEEEEGEDEYEGEVDIASDEEDKSEASQDTTLKPRLMEATEADGLTTNDEGFTLFGSEDEQDESVSDLADQEILIEEISSDGEDYNDLEALSGDVDEGDDEEVVDDRSDGSDDNDYDVVEGINEEFDIAAQSNSLAGQYFGASDEDDPIFREEYQVKETGYDSDLAADAHAPEASVQHTHHVYDDKASNDWLEQGTDTPGELLASYEEDEEYVQIEDTQVPGELSTKESGASLSVHTIPTVKHAHGPEPFPSDALTAEEEDEMYEIWKTDIEGDGQSNPATPPAQQEVTSTPERKHHGHSVEEVTEEQHPEILPHVSENEILDETSRNFNVVTDSDNVVISVLEKTPFDQPMSEHELHEIDGEEAFLEHLNDQIQQHESDKESDDDDDDDDDDEGEQDFPEDLQLDDGSADEEDDESDVEEGEGQEDVHGDDVNDFIEGDEESVSDRQSQTADGPGNMDGDADQKQEQHTAQVKDEPVEKAETAAAEDDNLIHTLRDGLEYVDDEQVRRMHYAPRIVMANEGRHHRKSPQK